MKTKVHYATALLFTAVLFTACSKNEKVATPEEALVPPKVISEYIKQDAKTGVYQVTNLPLVTTGGKYEQEGFTQHKMYKPLYFNLGKAEIVTDDKATGLEWDLVFMDANALLNGAALFNNGTVNNRPWSKNGSLVIGAFITEDFDNVKNIPSEVNFSQKAISAQYSGPLAQSWALMMNTELGLLSYYAPQKNLTFVIRLNDGRLVKFAMQNIYKVNDVTKPYESNATSTGGFLTFKYAVFPKGSTDLNTVK